MNFMRFLATPAEEARTILARLGVPASAFAPHGLACRSPITGEVIAHLADRARRRRGGARARLDRLPHLAGGAGTPPRRARAAHRRGAARRQGRSRPPRDHRGRQDRLGGARRGAGDDRHLRFRRRPVAPIARPHRLDRAAGPPHDGNLAPDRGMSASSRPSTSRSRSGPGTRRSPRLRQSGRVEALREDAAFGARGQGARRARGEALRRGAGRLVRGARRRARGGRGADRRRACGARLGDRLDRDGPGARRRASRGASPAPSSSSAATTPRS